MRKLFLLIPAMLLTLAVNAEVKYIDNSTADALRVALGDANSGDIIEMAAGTYVESPSNGYIAFDAKNIIVRAAEDAEVIIKPHVPFTIGGGARAELRGIKIDASELLSVKDWYENIIETADSTEGNKLILEDCEIYGNVAKTVARCASDKLLDSLIINNCYIHDNAQVVLRLESPALKGLTITNTTIANTTNGGSFWVAPISVGAGTDLTVLVNHCTFYHNTSISSSYADVTVTASGANVTISNSIFAQPSSYDASRAININGGTVQNCLTYNYTKSTNGIQGATSTTGCLVGNPYFVNTEVGSYDFTPASFSIAHNAGTDTKTLGDYLRWKSADSAHPTTKNITAGTDALKAAVDAAWPGDEIILAEGTYNETGMIGLNKNITIKAAEGAAVTVKPYKDNQITNGAKVKFENIKFDGSEETTSYFIRSYDDSDGKELRLKGCEITGFTSSNLIYAEGASRTLDSVIINNCICTNGGNNAIFIGQGSSTKETAKGVVVKNSTFANFTGLSHGLIEVRNYDGSTDANIEVTVDRCTFYNDNVTNTDYGHIRSYKSTKVNITNCIFAHPTAMGACATKCYGGTISNCVTYNTGYSDYTSGHYSGPTITNNVVANPLFKDAANNDFTLNMASPARRPDGSVWGDPRWAEEIDPISLATLPATLAPLDALLSDSAGVVLGSPNVLDFKGRFGSHKYNSTEWAKWKIHGNGGYCVFTINGNNTKDGNTQQYVIKIYDPVDEAHPVLNETSTSYTVIGAYTYTTGVVQLEDKDYIVKVTSPVSWSEGDIVSIVASYGGGNAVNISSSTSTTLNVADAVYPSGYTRADGQISPNSSWSSAGYAKWNVATDETSFYNITLNFSSTNAHNMTVSIYEDENAAPVASIGEGGYTSTTGTLTLTDRVYLAGGKNYIVKVTNETDGSKAKITSVAFAPVATPATALPGTLDPSDAILSPLAYVSGDQLYFVPSEQAGHITEQWAQWKVSVSAAQNYLFTMEVSSTNEQSYRITIIDSDDNEIAVYDKRPSSGNQTLTHYFYLTAGTYFVKVQNTYKWSNGHVVSLVVSNPPEGMITIEEDGAPETVNGIISDNLNQAGKTIQLIRTIVGGMYNTICLPFNVDDNLVKEVFGNDVQLRTLASAEIEEGGFVLNLNFNSASDIYPGTPHLIKTSRNIVNPVFAGVEITTTSTSSTTKTNADFIGNFVAGTITASEDNLFLGANNTLYFPTQEIEILGMRAYFKVHDAPGAPAGMIKRARIVENEQILTDVELVRSQEPIVNSQKLIENGQLIIVRDGQKYNVMGVKLQ